MASAATAPVIPAVFFSSAASVFGLCVDKTCLVAGATTGGGLQSLAAGADGAILTRTAGALEFATSPTISGTLTVSTGIDVTGGSTVTGDLTIAGNNDLAISGTGTLTVGGETTLTGAVGVAGGINMTVADLALGDGCDITLTDGNITMTSGDLTVTGGTIEAAAITIGGQAVATQLYVDGIATGLHAMQPVRLRTVAALAFTPGGTTWSSPSTDSTVTLTNSGAVAALQVDGIPVEDGDRILVDQIGTGTGDNSKYVGIYTVTTKGTGSINWVLTRATNANTPAKLAPGSYVFVTEGATSADKGYVLTTDAPITLDVTELEFAQFSSISGAAGSTSYVQYKGSDSAFAGDSDFQYNPDGTGLLYVNNLKTTTSGVQLGLSTYNSGAGNMVMVGATTNQTAPGDSVAFGLSSSASEANAIALGSSASASADAAIAHGKAASAFGARSIAIGAAAIARVVDSMMVPAIPIAQKYGTSNLGTAGNRGLASSISFLPSAVMDFKVAGSSTVNIPAGAMFLPLGAAIWISSVSSPSAENVVFSVGITGTTTAFVSGQTLTLSSSSVQGQMRSYGLSGTSPYAIATNVNIVYTIDTEAASSTAVSGRIALYGMYVEQE